MKLETWRKMIRAIRKRHRVIWLVLAIVLPLLLAASVAFRHREPLNQNVPRAEIKAAP